MSSRDGFNSTPFLPWAFQGIPSDDRFTTTDKPPQMNHPNFNISEILSKASIDLPRTLVFVRLARLGCCDNEGEADTGVDCHRSCPIKRTRPVYRALAHPIARPNFLDATY